jgi:hypothetical protein
VCVCDGVCDGVCVMVCVCVCARAGARTSGCGLFINRLKNNYNCVLARRD